MSRQAREGDHLEETIPAVCHSPVRDLSFCLANLAADLALFIWAHPSGTDGAVQGRKKVNLVFQTVEGTPGRKKTARRTDRVSQMDREVGGWRSGVIRNAADPRSRKKGWTRT